MSAAIPKGHIPYYFVPPPSAYPVLAASGLFFVILGAGQWVNGQGWGAYSLAAGLLAWALVMFSWFGTAIQESEGGLYSDRIDVSFRWSMSWFIFSAVMFFGAFFGALFWARLHALPNLGSLENAMARFPCHLAQCSGGCHRLTYRHSRALCHHWPLAPAYPEHRVAAHFWRHTDHRTPRRDRWPARPHHRLHVDDGDPGRRVLGCSGR